MDDLRRGFLEYRRTVYPLQRETLAKLAAQGQRPTTLMIGCSDSRMKIGELVQAGPGRMFIVRNAGNIVPRYGEFVGGVTASIEFAVTLLPIREIVVCGHSGCGAIDAMLHPEKYAGMPAVSTWLGYAAEAPRRAQSHDPLASDSAMADRTARENVLLQVENLRTFPCVIEREQKGVLQLHAWYFAIESADLWEYHEREKEWRTLA